MIIYSQRKRSSSSGQMLILTAFFVFILFVLAFSLFQLIPVEFNSALRTRQAIAGEIATSSGFKDAVAWLKSQSGDLVLRNQELEEYYNSDSNNPRVDLGNSWAYKAKIYENPSGYTLYDIVSTAYFDGQPIRQARATVSAIGYQEYALFIDQWNSDEQIFGMEPGLLQGPFHTNSFFRLGHAKLNSVYDFDEPFVSGDYARLTHAKSYKISGNDGYSDGNKYFEGGGTEVTDYSHLPYQPSGADQDRTKKVVEGGTANMRQTETIPLPEHAARLRALATDAGPGHPAFDFDPEFGTGFAVAEANGKVTGGILVKGAVNIALSLDDRGNQIQSLTQSISDKGYEYSYLDTVAKFTYETRTIPAGETAEEWYRETIQVEEEQIVGYEDGVELVSETKVIGYKILNGISVPIKETVQVEKPVKKPILAMVKVDKDVWKARTVTLTEPKEITVRVPDGTEEVTRKAIVSEAEYTANPSQYPDARVVQLAPSSKTGAVVEVTAESGFNGALLGQSVSASKGQTVVVDYDGNVSIKDGSLNGVTFVEGNVDGLSGVSKGAVSDSSGGQKYAGRYIVANPLLSGKMKITGDLLNFYDGSDSDLKDPTSPFTLKRGKLNPNGDHGLGLIAQTVEVRPDSHQPTINPARLLSNDDDQKDYLDIYAQILAGRARKDSDESVGGFGVDPDSLKADARTAMYAFRLFGGIVESQAYPWNDGVARGFKGKLTFNPATAFALPNFPKTNKEIRTLRYTDHFRSQP